MGLLSTSRLGWAWIAGQHFFARLPGTCSESQGGHLFSGFPMLPRPVTTPRAPSTPGALGLTKVWTTSPFNLASPGEQSHYLVIDLPPLSLPPPPTSSRNTAGWARPFWLGERSLFQSLSYPASHQGHRERSLLHEPTDRLQESAAGAGAQSAAAEPQAAAADPPEPGDPAQCEWGAAERCARVQVAVPEPPLELPHGFGAPPLRQDRQPRWVPRKAAPPGLGELGVTHRARVGERREDVPGCGRGTPSTGRELYARRQLCTKLSPPDAFKPCTSDAKLHFPKSLPQKQGVLNCGR